MCLASVSSLERQRKSGRLQPCNARFSFGAVGSKVIFWYLPATDGITINGCMVLGLSQLMHTVHPEAPKVLADIEVALDRSLWL